MILVQSGLISKGYSNYFMVLQVGRHCTVMWVTGVLTACSEMSSDSLRRDFGLGNVLIQ
jgi:hypothetical protein